MATLKAINIIVSFLLEIAMLLAFGYWGFYTGQSLWLKLVLGIGVPLLAIFLWGLFLAPRSDYRAGSTTGIVVSLALFYLAAFALFLANQPVLAAVMVVVAALNRTLVVIWKQW